LDTNKKGMRIPAASTIWEYGRMYHGRIYGGSFKLILDEDSIKPYNIMGIVLQ
jgi:hypothetical protein